VDFAPGYVLDPNQDATGLVDDAVALAQSSELVVLFLGLPASYEAEGRDRNTIELPADQVALVKALAAVNPEIVVALSNGSAVTTAEWRDRVGSIIEFWLTGQAHGDSIADVLLGDLNPSGKLPETVPVRLVDTPSYLDFPGEVGHVRHSEGIYVGYRWFDARRLEVDYPFGHGLSYTTFDYAALVITVHNLDHPIAFTVALSLTTRVPGTAPKWSGHVGDRSGSCRCLNVTTSLRQGAAQAGLTTGGDCRRPPRPRALPPRGRLGIRRRPDGGACRILIPRHSTADDRRGPRASGRGPSHSLVATRGLDEQPGHRTRATQAHRGAWWHQGSYR
jgi:hypothetical protein